MPDEVQGATALAPRRKISSLQKSMSGFSNREEYILPILVPPGEIAEEILDNNERFKIIWDVLQAMRAHEDRLDVIVNKFTIVGVTIDDDSPVKQPGEEPPNLKDTQAAVTQYLFSFPVEELKDALYAKIVKKCGDRKTLIQWAKDVADIATRHIAQIKEILDFPIYRESFNKFRDGLRQDLNPDITDDEVIDMLSQHLITEPVFNALFGGSAFAKENPVSQSLNAMIDTLKKAGFDGEIQKLEKFYKRVEMQASGDRTAEGKQKFVLELYDNFFKVAFPRMAERLGIVYTPVEVVDWIVKAVDQALRQEFGKGITDKDIHVLDPFTGTGTFIVRLLQSGLIAPKDLRRKYESELHANELVLLAYYIAAINIENTFREVATLLPSAVCNLPSFSFPGIVHTDTFTVMNEITLGNIDNNKRAKKQKESAITVIIGNPPYSAGAKDFGDGTKRTSYKQIEERVRQTYAETSIATNKNSLYDSYIRAFRWASDRIDNRGIICFVTNSGWLDGSAMEGFRKCLTEEFTDIYVFNLLGGIRGKQGDAAKKEGDNVFDIMTGVAITLLIKNPMKAGKPCTIHYRGIGDYKKREEKFHILNEFTTFKKDEWILITPNKKHDWINQRCEEFDGLIGIDEVFRTKTLGVQTNRDAWCYNFSKNRLAENITRMVAFYNEQVETYNECKKHDKDLKADDFIVYNPSRISWSRSLKNLLKRRKKIQFSRQNVVSAMYRPFCKSHFYFDRPLNHEVSQMPRIFPKPGLENVVIGIETGKMGQTFSCLVIDTVPDCCVFGYTQCFPLYTYERIADQVRNRKVALLDPQSTDCGSDGVRVGDYIRRENISDVMLQKFRKRYGDQSRNHKIAEITKEDIFYYVYGILHSESYKTRFAANLKKQLPRIPMVDDFWTFSKAGRKLAALHLNYETGAMYPLEEHRINEHRINEYRARSVSKESHHVTKMKFSSKTDKGRIIYSNQLHLGGIPVEAYRYIVNGKSAIEWIMDRYQISTHKDSGIVNDPNDWCKEQGNDRYIVDLIKRIVYLSVESVKIIEGLPSI